MSISSNGRGWKEVTPKNPCPVCKHASWCRFTDDGALCACRRTDAGGEHRTDKSGADYWLHKLQPSTNGKKWPEPQYTLADCPKDKEGNPIVADIETRHRVYSQLLACLPLRRLHREDLERRGIRDQQREAGYRTLGSERAEAAYQLVKAGLEQYLPSVPGFYIAEKNGKRYWSVAGMGGMLIPIRNAQGRIVALSVRLDNPSEDGGKYRYVSSKKKGGPGSGSPVHVPLFEGDKSLARVTEGALKANAATRLSNILTIGLPGVASWRRAARVLAEIGVKTVRVALDADARRKVIVARSLESLIAHLRGKGLVVELETWKEEDGKGIDDLLLAGKNPEVLTTSPEIDSAVAEIVTAAEKADPTPKSLASEQVNESFDNPHLLAREYRKRFQHAAIDTLYFHRQEFFRWDNRAYRPLDDKEIKAELTGSIKTAFDKQNLKQLVSWRAKGSQGFPPVAKAVTTKIVGNTAQALTDLALLPGSVQPPAWIRDCEQEWNAVDVLACKNALVHLPSFAEKRDHSSIAPTPLFFSLNAVDYDFDPEATKPVNWLAFLGQVWEDDRQAIEALQDWFGYCLLPDTSQQKILMLVGPRRSGKGTIARILRALIGIHNTASPTLASLGTNFGLQPLLNKTLAIISDARLSGRTDAAVVTERLLSISGEDAQDIDRKHKSAVNVKLPVRFVVLTNELPRLNDPSGALVGRLVLLRQTKSFFGKEDTRLTDRLLTELPGILLWAIEGWQRLRARGYFVQPDSGAKLVQQMEDLSSPVGVFIRECCQVGPGYEIPCKDLFQSWEKWCEEKGHRDTGSDQIFGRDLRAAIPGLDTKQPRCGSMRIRVYTGIRLLASDEDEVFEKESEDAWVF